jgi:tetratricopeptide (TPR) repeat protein
MSRGGKKRRERSVHGSGARTTQASPPPAAIPSAPVRAKRTRKRTWLFRIAAALLAPVVCFVVLEAGLRLMGYGAAPGFFIRGRGRDSVITNERFGWRFFPPALARAPVARALPLKPEKAERRIFILGSSAAMGTPEPAYGFGRFLEFMLSERLPDTRCTVVNAAMTAINSHVARVIADDCARLSPDVFVVYLGNNEVVGPYGCGTVFAGFRSSLPLIRASILLTSTRTGQWLSRLKARGGGPAAWKGMEMFLANRIAADDPRLEKVCGHFRANVEAICDTARRAGAKVVLCTVGCDLKDTPPFAGVHREGLAESDRMEWERLFEEASACLRDGRPAEALPRLEKAEQLDDRHANLHFRRGQAWLALGELEKSRAAFVRARDLDALRFRADTRINGILRDVARARAGDGVVLVDAEEGIARAALGAGTLPGRELFHEHVHFTPEGNDRLARMVLDPVARAVGDAGAVADPPAFDQAVEWLALTGWDRYRIGADMAKMQDRPPFDHQLDHSGRKAERAKQLRAMEARWASPQALDEAEHVYDRALSRRPDDPDLRRGYAELLSRRGDPVRAAAQWRTLLQAYPDNDEWRSELGQALGAAGKEEEAIAEFRKVLRASDSVRATMLFNIGTMRFRQQRTEEAEAAFRSALKANPGHAKARNSLAALLIKKGSVEEGMAELERVLASDPADKNARHNLAAAYLGQRNFAQAAEQYREALRLDPEDAELHKGLASVLGQADRPDEALEQYRQAVRLDPDYADGWFALGVFLQQRNRWGESVRPYREVLRIHPDDLKAGHNLGDALNRSGKTGDAVAQYRAVLTRHPQSAPTARSLALVLCTHPDPALRNGAEAVRLMENVSADPAHASDPGMQDALAAAYAEVGRFDKAVTVVQSAIRRAEEAGDSRGASLLRERLTLYTNRKPLRSAPQP